MKDLILKLFAKKCLDAEKPIDGLSQKENEALIDLLIIGMYIDRTLTLSEDKVMNDTVSSLNWQSGASLDYYINERIGTLRGLINTDTGIEDTLQYIGERLVEEPERKLAVRLLSELCHAEGEASLEKRAFVDRVKSFLLG
jgi:hypothetical protein